MKLSGTLTALITPFSGDGSVDYGALRSLCLRLIRRYPTKRIVLMTPLHRRSENATTNEIGLPCHPLRDYVRAIKEVAAEFSLHLLVFFYLLFDRSEILKIQELRQHLNFGLIAVGEI